MFPCPNHSVLLFVCLASSVLPSRKMNFTGDISAAASSAFTLHNYLLLFSRHEHYAP
jgi:hypothetical protein